ncbi:hypothetical protein QJS10_CPA05g00896 [Acorus calamus]|uniref:Protein NEOXANTHIN-DEFICIENT 1 n=1 Tax=Acorus calamus TaxID=4465 RepID=A0AAV9ERW7_ACOCL|nr:hypothetical protein QJS10_CPA05g00896 [Acorus calamus]
MEDSKAPSYAHGPPWSFKGCALYQLHLVKAETARAFIPRELKLVEAFGYTLGGFFLAQYEGSPAGKFDELVVIAGTVWNPPTSCAWATRVLVNSHEACEHGRKHVGLPSHVATFLKRTERISDEPRDKRRGGLLNIFHRHYSFHKPKDSMEIEVSDTKGSTMTTFCNINMSSSLLNSKTNTMWMPMLRLSLPSFSGHTEYHPDLLKYSCQIECRVQVVKPAKISGPSSALKNDGQSKGQLSGVNGFDAKPSVEEDARECSISVMQSKPILALKFNLLRMQVEAPTTVLTN